MDAIAMLQFQATMANDLLTQVFASVTADQGAWRLDGSTANTITPTFLHVYISEDRVVSGALGRAPLWESGEWGARLGVDPTAPWSMAPLADLAPCRDYANAVHATTEGLLSALDEAALDRAIPTPRGARPLGEALSFALVLNKIIHLGEISALIGCQGERGFPY